MKVGITGYNGFIGSNLHRFLTYKHIEIIFIEKRWLYNSPKLLAEKIEGLDAIINLAGASINKRWSRKYKLEIYQSRVKTTKNLVKAISLCKKRPKKFISASAIGIYDSTHKHDEQSNYLASSFLGKVCRDWEAAALHAENYGIEVSIVRFGIVLGPNGGMLKKLLPIFKWGLGGTIGNGKQTMSFIHIDDLISILYSILTESIAASVYNATTPYPTTNKDFTITFAKKLKRPHFLTVPDFMLKILFGEGAEVLTSGQFVLPQALIEKNFTFQYLTIDQAIQASLLY
ncbi:MAG TPA: TIGR01777 family oxidoreductase [Bacteroidales bacterium]|jgi:uncharacterized protein (TIGR01777 family)|nr:TIGR01777 family protein [Bacteroidales bacterium]HNV96092.1 TIGR01777 family oxidoreductase [Bacteroidales bacterium]HOU99092.1 TIGR01777 family oxidoreductase [Bacteroidales bacterium]